MSEACGENTRGANQRTARQFRAFVAKRQWQHMAMGSTRRWVGAGFTGRYPLLTSTLCSKADMKRCLGLVSSSISGYSTWFEPRPASQSVSQCEATKGEHRAGHRLVRGSMPHGSSIFLSSERREGHMEAFQLSPGTATISVATPGQTAWLRGSPVSRF